MKKVNLNICSCVLSMLLLIVSSCYNTKHSVYFANQQNGSLPADVPIPPTIIQENDILSITVSGLNSVAAAIFNTPNIVPAGTNTNNVVPGLATPFAGYVVDADGNIQFPVLGDLKAKGMTTASLKEDIVKRILDKKLLVDPIVTVRFLNFKVTVLGEVGHPMVINVPNQKISLLEALGLAGDITIYGKKDNVMIIREEEDKSKKFYRIDLNSSELFNSPYYYLKSNDVVYVEPTKARVGSSSRANTLLPILLSGLSFIAIIIDRVTR